MLLFLLLPTLEKTDIEALRAKSSADVKFDVGDKVQTFSMGFGETTVVVGHMPMPIPGSEVIDCASVSRLWKQPPEATSHASHLVLVAAGELPQLERAKICARAAADISEAISVVGWYSGNSEQVIDPQIGTDLAREEDIQLVLWVNVVISQDDATHWSLSTIGMRSFGHSEFEVVETTMDPTDCMWRIYDMAYYVLDNGPILKHGQTFGEDAYQQYKIEVGRSKLGKDGTVIRLAIP